MTNPLDQFLNDAEKRAVPPVSVEMYEQDEGIYLRWTNPWNGSDERIAAFYWPTHPPTTEATECAEHIIENMALYFARARARELKFIELARVMKEALEKFTLPRGVTCDETAYQHDLLAEAALARVTEIVSKP